LGVARKLYLAISLVILILISGIAGYRLIEGWSFFDAFYMTIITVSTVGYKEVAPLSLGGKIFTLILIVGGVGTVVYALGIMVEFLVEGHFTGILGRRRMRKQIEKLKNHYIICGFGRVGEQISKELESASVPFVIIDNNAERISKCEQENLLNIEGDASEDQILEAAGLKKAKGLIAVVDNDADNVMVTLSAKGLNPEIFVVARAEYEESERKLKKAGANRVVSPSTIGGRRMAALLLKPLVCDYLDVVAHGENILFQLEETEIKQDAKIANMSIKNAGVRDKTGVLIMAVKKGDGKIITNPPPSVVLEAKDRLVVMGTKEQLEKWQSII